MVEQARPGATCHKNHIMTLSSPWTGLKLAEAKCTAHQDDFVFFCLALLLREEPTPPIPEAVLQTPFLHFMRCNFVQSSQINSFLQLNILNFFS